MLFEFETNMYNDNKEIDSLYDLDEGFTKGNFFKNLYDQYKHYQPKEVKAKSEQEAHLLKLYQLSLAINDLNLYLDLNKDDFETYQIFKKYSLMYDKCLKEYEEKYQVLEVCHDIYDKYTWDKNPWPWEGNYV